MKQRCGQPVDLFRHIRPVFIRSYLAAHFRVDSLSRFIFFSVGVSVRSQLNQATWEIKQI